MHKRQNIVLFWADIYTAHACALTATLYTCIWLHQHHDSDVLYTFLHVQLRNSPVRMHSSLKAYLHMCTVMAWSEGKLFGISYLHLVGFLWTVTPCLSLLWYTYTCTYTCTCMYVGSRTEGWGARHWDSPLPLITLMVKITLVGLLKLAGVVHDTTGWRSVLLLCEFSVAN